MSLLIGLDVGTTSVKAGLYAPSGQLLGAAAEEYLLDHPGPDRARDRPRGLLGGDAGRDRQSLERIASRCRGRRGHRRFEPGGDGDRRRRGWPAARPGSGLARQPGHGRGAGDRPALRRRRPSTRSRACPRSFPPGPPARSSGGAVMSPRCSPGPAVPARRGLHPAPADRSFRHRGQRRLHLARSSTSSSAAGGSPCSRFVGIGAERLPELIDPARSSARSRRPPPKRSAFPQRALVVAGGMDQCAGAVGVGNVGPGHRLGEQRRGADPPGCRSTATAPTRRARPPSTSIPRRPCTSTAPSAPPAAWRSPGSATSSERMRWSAPQSEGGERLRPADRSRRPDRSGRRRPDDAPPSDGRLQPGV